MYDLPQMHLLYVLIDFLSASFNIVLLYLTFLGRSSGGAVGLVKLKKSCSNFTLGWTTSSLYHTE